MDSEFIFTIVAIAVAVVELVAVLTAGRAIMQSRTSQGAIAWGIALVTFPFVSLPLYWVFGRSKFRGYARLKSSNDREIHHLIEAVTQAAAEKELVVRNLSGESRALEKLADMPFTRCNDARLLVDGAATFESIFEGIRFAADYVLVQFFIIHEDRLGNRLRDLLVQKAREGVRVYLLYDEIGCHKLSAPYLEGLRAAGVKSYPFHTTKGRANRFQLNFRNHRKIVVVDGRAAWVGGHNVGDGYLGEDPRFGAWRDTHVRVEGPAVQCLQFSFLEDWYWATHAYPKLNWHPHSEADADIKALVVPSGPADDLETCGLMFIHAIQSARERIWIASPYFVPDAQVISALQLAALRGVEVRILLPEKPDHRLVYWASFSYYSEILPLGIEIYRYQAGFMHQKVALVDGTLAAVGTANFDNRSFRLNFEITLLFDDRAFAEAVEEMLTADFNRSRMASMDDFDKRSLVFKLAVRFSRLLSPIL